MKPDIASRIVGSAIALLGVCATTPALAEAPPPPSGSRVCTPSAAALRDQLAKEYGENLHAAGADDAGNLVQVYSNLESGTWTIAVTLPKGPTCIVSSGEGWAFERTLDAPKPGVGS